MYMVPIEPRVKYLEIAVFSNIMEYTPEVTDYILIGDFPAVFECEYYVIPQPRVGMAETLTFSIFDFHIIKLQKSLKKTSFSLGFRYL